MGTTVLNYPSTKTGDWKLYAVHVFISSVGIFVWGLLVPFLLAIVLKNPTNSFLSFISDVLAFGAREPGYYWALSLALVVGYFMGKGIPRSGARWSWIPVLGWFVVFSLLFGGTNDWSFPLYREAFFSGACGPRTQCEFFEYGTLPLTTSLSYSVAAFFGERMSKLRPQS